MKTITAHCIIKNEERFIAYAIKSVIDFVDHVLVFDTGSEDATIAIVQDLVKKYPHKIIFEQKGEQTKESHTLLRQEMLSRTTTDWFMILDGDEVWTKRALREAMHVINNNPPVDWLIAPYYLCVGDVYHSYRKESYDPFYKKPSWFFTPRFIKKLPGLTWRGQYEVDTLYRENGAKLYTNDAMYFLANKFWHLTHLQRSTLDGNTFTSGIAKNRSEKRRLTYFIIGKKINEPIPEVFTQSEYEAGLGFIKSVVGFAKLVVRQPKLLLRKLAA